MVEKIDVNSSTDKNRITLSIGVRINTYTEKDGTTRTVYEHLRFVKFYRFLRCFLEKLARHLLNEKFKILDNCFPNDTEAKSSFINKVSSHVMISTSLTDFRSRATIEKSLDGFSSKWECPVIET